MEFIWEMSNKRQIPIHQVIAALQEQGFRITADDPKYIRSDVPEEFLALNSFIRPYTMLYWERLLSIYDSTQYICKNEVPGDIVECGVWKGGCAMLMAQILHRLGDESRHLYLYDTFAGMSEPTDRDVAVAGPVKPRDKHALLQRDGYNKWCFAPVGEVESNLARTEFPTARVHLVKGKVEETIPTTMPERVALIHLDTDWYESTKHELRHLFPRLAKGGVLVVDDYGDWQGARTAVDEYLAETGTSILLTRVAGAVVGVKQS